MMYVLSTMHVKINCNPNLIKEGLFMLRKLEEKEFDKYLDMMYELACDYSKSSYPTYNDGIQTKEIFYLIVKMPLSKIMKRYCYLVMKMRY